MKCVSLDLDGTLLNSEHIISNEDRETVNLLKDTGYQVIINTGRQYKDIIKIHGVKELNCPIICLNGSMIYSATGEIIYETTIDPTLYSELIRLLKELEVGILVYTNKGGFPATLPLLHNKSLEEINKMFAEQDYYSILKIEDIKIYKLIAWVDHSQLEKIQMVKEHLRKFASIACSSSFPNNVEITSSEAQKGKAIRRFESLTGVSFSEIYSFGDGGNDISQFEISTASFAMDNAPEEIKEKASHVTKSNNESGVSFAIKHILELI
ncbi:Cof-type HAD-IIB family hydrolase [Litchfieldia alkalitelluris]|uniref:Cof-type HAD-IIB family hydrolase n=1 Tax=Litchfieldia alkalitelluris TaxID=304268 RepID=UPI0009983DC1|nr:Cof-type HAD-IIB family hydrolase [Litchfieldia alkalitelluris]